MEKKKLYLYFLCVRIQAQWYLLHVFVKNVSAINTHKITPLQILAVCPLWKYDYACRQSWSIKG